MSNFTIIHPTDFSEPSSAAMDFASAHAERLSAKLLIVHVVVPAATTVATGAGFGYPVVGAVPAPEDSPGAPPAKRTQLLAIRPASAAVECEHALLEGVPAEEIVRLAEQTDADLIVMGSHGRTGLQRLLIGSVAEAVVRRAPCPVTIVKSGVAEGD